ncbi:hypothetical protein QQP08_026389 [Theobroma cacao]|nr:hypothetical protein QQP08_026389 [Theobroma cacao]
MNKAIIKDRQVADSPATPRDVAELPGGGGGEVVEDGGVAVDGGGEVVEDGGVAVEGGGEEEDGGVAGDVGGEMGEGELAWGAGTGAEG